MSDRPLDTLEASLGASVTVELKDGRAFYGTLDGYDQHMNVVLVAPDAPTDLETDAREIRDTTIIRGDNVVRIET